MNEKRKILPPPRPLSKKKKKQLLWEKVKPEIDRS